jgi:His/Glu/Gln/Arg/opine family amino acid ABC transporter permease subunit
VADPFAYLPFVLRGTFVTIALSVSALVVATVVGLLGSWAKASSSQAIRTTAEAYTTVIRGIPDLVLMLLFYYGGQAALNRLGEVTGLWAYTALDPFTIGVLALGFIFGSYMTETFRGAFLSIPPGQADAAKALGLSGSLMFRHVLWPQLLRNALPSFSNNWLTLLKSTALVSVIGLEDIVNKGYAAGRATQQPFAFLFVVFLVYLALTAVSDVGLRALGRHFRVSQGG